MGYTISLGKHENVVAGLYWFAPKIAGKPNEVKQAVSGRMEVASRVLGGTPNMGVLHRGKALPLQIGLGFQDAHNPKEKQGFPLAMIALLGNAVMGSFVGRLALTQDVHWLVTVRSGVIMPLGDRVVDASTADAEFIKLKAENRDIDQAFDITSPDELSQIIKEWRKKGKGTGEKIRTVSSIGDLYSISASQKRAVIIWCALAVFVASAGMVGKAVLKHQEALAEKEKLEIQRQEELRIRNLPIEKPWEDKPSINQLVDTCNEAYDLRPKRLQGWEMESWECSPGTAVETWRRTTEGIFSIMPKGTGFDGARPNIARLVKSIRPAEAQGMSPIANAEEAARYLLDVGMLGRASVDIAWGREATRRIPKEGEMVDEPLGYAKNIVTISLNERPSLQFFRQLSMVPSLYLEEIKRNGTSWELKAEFYSDQGQ